MVFLPLTVWLLGKTYGKVKKISFENISAFFNETENRRRPKRI